MVRSAPARRPMPAGSARARGGWEAAWACACRCARFLPVRQEPAAPPVGTGRSSAGAPAGAVEATGTGIQAAAGAAACASGG
eukprot:5333443-Alexandrium_andersonii.AAC.1